MKFVTAHLDEVDEAGIFYWMKKVDQLRPYVRRGRGIDVTRSGVWRAVVTYALVRINEIAAVEGDEAAGRLLRIGVEASPGSRAKISKFKILLPQNLSDQISGRGRQLADVDTVKDAVTVLLNFGLRQLRKENTVEVAEFLKQHFDDEALSGLRRGRRAA